MAKEISKNYAAKRMGNEESRPGKREAFKEAKAERSSLADSIHSAFKQRGVWEDNEANIWNKLPDVDGEIANKKFKTDSAKVRSGRK